MDNNIRSEKFKDLKIKLEMKTQFLLRDNTAEIYGVWIQNLINSHKFWVDYFIKEIEVNQKHAEKSELDLLKSELQKTSDLHRIAVDLAAEWDGIS